jgi:organic radical activating enzyme
MSLGRWKMPSFCFIATEVCNWECNYCDFVKIEEPRHTNIDILKKHLPYIAEIIHKIDHYAVHIDIAGGEIGLLPIEILRYFFETIDRPIVVSTNGLFLEKGYHHDPIIRSRIREVQWHVFDHPRGVKIDVDYNDDEIFINKGIVGQDAQGMVDFCESNPNIQMNYVEFEFDMDQPRQKNDELYKKFYEMIKNIPNITDNAKNIIQGRLTEKENLRELCEKFNQTVVTDLINERIMFCHRSQNVTIPLNRKNFIKRIKTFPKDLFFKDKKCNACTRLYAGKMCGNEIETYFKTRDIPL